MINQIFICFFPFQLCNLKKCHAAIVYCAHNECVKPNVFKILLKRWQTLLHYEDVLNILAVATTKLQTESLTLSDAYGIWLIATLKLRYIVEKKQYATIILESALLKEMADRKKKTLESNVCVAATFIDPRYRNDLTVSQKMKAKLFITKLWRKLNAGTIPETSPLGNPSDSHLLRQHFASQTSNAVSNEILEEKFVHELSQYTQTETSIDEELSFISFASEIGEHYPELNKVIKYLITIPPTQVSVERAFSTFSFIFNKNRCSLSQENLEHILTIKLNKERALNVFKMELKQIEDGII